jgi:hypothetical protein
MNLALLILSLLLLLLIAWNDIRHRSIPLLFMVFEAIIAITMMITLKLPGYWQMVLLTFGAVILQLLLLWGWFRFMRKTTAFFDALFGWGDLVMIAIVAFHFSMFPFMLFLVISSLIGLIWHFAKNVAAPSISPTIPLAGVMALLLIPAQVANHLGVGWFYYNPYHF